MLWTMASQIVTLATVDLLLDRANTATTPFLPQLLQMCMNMLVHACFSFNHLCSALGFAFTSCILLDCLPKRLQSMTYRITLSVNEISCVTYYITGPNSQKPLSGILTGSSYRVTGNLYITVIIFGDQNLYTNAARRGRPQTP